MSRLSKVLSVAGLAAGLLLCGQGPRATANPKQPSPYAQHIQELHAVKTLLETANHDYKGHRVAAIKEIHAAMHSLAEGHQKYHQHQLGKAKGGGEPQALSDTQLKEAAQKLGAVQGQLVGVKDARAVKAVNNLQTAIKELETALQIR